MPEYLVIKENEMIQKRPYQCFLSKTLHYTDQALRVFGTAKGLYEAGAGIASGLRSAYQIAAPIAAIL